MEEKAGWKHGASKDKEERRKGVGSGR